MFIAVYAICKNEADVAERWAKSMSEADYITVLDTGSEDSSEEILRAHSAHVERKIIEPWRFDTARNLSLALVPEEADICVCTDLDDVFHEGWRDALERAWVESSGRASYRYTWSFNPDGSEGGVLWQSKIHARQGYSWAYPIHEVLKWVGEGNEPPTVTVRGIQLDHRPTAVKAHAEYLPLLELAARETPNDDRVLHYLGREYMYHRRWDECISTLSRHLALPTALWRDERATSMRFIAFSFLQKGENQKARDWYLRAIAEAPHLREAYVELALQLYGERDWDGVLYFSSCALKITEQPMSYICDAAPWGSLPHDLRAIALYETGRLAEALTEAEKALALSPEDERLRKNVEFMQKRLAGF